MMYLYLFFQKRLVSYTYGFHVKLYEIQSVVLLLWKYISTAVILSVPIPSEVSTASMSSSIISTGLCIPSFFAFVFFMVSVKNSIHYWLVKQSQIPSHASIINLSSLLRGLFTISGWAVTANYSGGNVTESLY